MEMNIFLLQIVNNNNNNNNKGIKGNKVEEST